MISIVIPVFNAAKYIDRCLESVLNQTIRDFNVWLVDDCSTDESLQLCKKWAAIDERINVIALPINKGSGVAKNAGLDGIFGDYRPDYIMFIDVDDFVHHKLIERLHFLLQDNNADVSWVSSKKVLDDEAFSIDATENGDRNISVIQAKDLLLRDDLRIVYSLLWAKLFKACLWQDVRFPEDNCRFYADGAATFKALYAAKTIVRSSEQLYYSVQSLNSNTRSKYSEQKCRDALFMCVEKLDFYSGTNEADLLDVAYNGYLNIIMREFKKCDELDGSDDLKNELKQLFRINYKKRLFSKHLSIEDKLRIIIFRISPKLKQRIAGFRNDSHL